MSQDYNVCVLIIIVLMAINIGLFINNLHFLIFQTVTDAGWITDKVWMDDSRLLNERNLTAAQPHTFYRQLRVKDLWNIHIWWLEWDSNLIPYVRKSPILWSSPEPSRSSFVWFLTIMIHLGKSCPNILPRTISADTVNTSNTKTHAPTGRKSRY